ncbi:pyrimidine dimer DNA glycosylase/endonuclease V [Motiliproteus sediminis]|uniref:pyrimidine dimer DNA glycosylase/endonuclease V n=1 Tax=Motiliproteus sediminis TaxID=1468178 RepID=UPI001AEF7E35|nr:pyrimidine dimer DNA glycosylase/endonuclease V [Motiliproteus sediminis]
MNIFVLDADIERCAADHCDQHVSKMILESVQILSTVRYLNGESAPYKPTHVHHPCVRWAGESLSNYLWLAELATALNREFCRRYARPRDHASMAPLRQIERCSLPERGLTPFAQAMPEQYRVAGDAVAAYRRFYLADKARFAIWNHSPAPAWWHAAELTCD